MKLFMIIFSNFFSVERNSIITKQAKILTCLFFVLRLNYYQEKIMRHL